MKIAVVGAGGFMGNLLVNQLSKNLKDDIVAISLNSSHINSISPNVAKHSCSIFDNNNLEHLLGGCGIIYYLVHMMASGVTEFPLLEQKAAESFCQAAKSTVGKKIIYLGGLGDDNQKLSKHLASRHKTGDILRDNIEDVIEFRASIIFGNGSASAEIIRQLVGKLRFMILPGWANTLTQPICVSDVLLYLISAADRKYKGHKIYEIGGPKAMSYKELMKLQAKSIGKRVYIVVINFLPRWPAKYWLGLFIDKKLKNTAISMIDSLENQAIVTTKDAQLDFAGIKPKAIDTGLALDIKISKA